MIVRDHLESRWQEMDESERAEHLIEGLVRTAQTKDVEVVRMFCPELTLAKMQEGNGQAFLRLFKFYWTFSSLCPESLFSYRTAVSNTPG